MLVKYLFSTYNINNSSTVSRHETMDMQTNSEAWNRRLQGKKLQNKSNKDYMHNHQDKETCEGYSKSKNNSRMRCPKPTEQKLTVNSMNL